MGSVLTAVKAHLEKEHRFIFNVFMVFKWAGVVYVDSNKQKIVRTSLNASPMWHTTQYKHNLWYGNLLLPATPLKVLMLIVLARCVHQMGSRLLDSRNLSTGPLFLSFSVNQRDLRYGWEMGLMSSTVEFD